MAVPADLTSRAVVGAGTTIAIMALLLFGAAWSLAYWQAWVYLAVFGGSTLAVTFYFLAQGPDLIERRLRAGPTAETSSTQQVIQAVASVAFIMIYVAAGTQWRLGGAVVSAAVSLIADAAVAVGFWIVFLTFRENRHASATIEVSRGQRVVTTGPYAIVRHPMYAGAGILLIATGPALGSLWTLLPIAILLAVIVWRLHDEERFLAGSLPGYAEYLRQTRYRLIPYLW